MGHGSLNGIADRNIGARAVDLHDAMRAEMTQRDHAGCHHIGQHLFAYLFPRAGFDEGTDLLAR
ncbi:hypothetical protein A3726_00440 [Erythrobacter sp. HI0037]|nr:hypothetical protein A3719_02600 [Erythrobacter sp. HI0020]KZY16660.1 hypothetical protein A3727_00615 [Erythrobacter sp. HI0038]KZY20206.1 hypothetical protein A3726_32370 [Erythrobacter sp. HI0037]KZY29011.1 hypothetical protein A3726_00440 [Erythrobacter sp. HI0037]